MARILLYEDHHQSLNYLSKSQYPVLFPLPAAIQFVYFLPDATLVIQGTVPIVSLRVPIPADARNEVTFDGSVAWKPVTADGAALIPKMGHNASVVFDWPTLNFVWGLAGLQLRTHHHTVDRLEFGQPLNSIFRAAAHPPFTIPRFWY